MEGLRGGVISQISLASIQRGKKKRTQLIKTVKNSSAVLFLYCIIRLDCPLEGLKGAADD